LTLKEITPFVREFFCVSALVKQYPEEVLIVMGQVLKSSAPLLKLDAIYRYTEFRK